jgi:hypothetical protein
VRIEAVIRARCGQVATVEGERTDHRAHERPGALVILREHPC